MKNKRQRKKLSKCKRLRREVYSLRGDLAYAQGKADRYEKRLFYLGLDENLEYLPDLPTKHVEAAIEIEKEPYGNYMVVSPDVSINTIKDEAIRRLTGDIVKALIDQNLARIIIKDADEPWIPYQSIAVRLDVIPWEEITTRRLIYRGGCK